MTLEELWQLFPICLTEYDPRWPIWYREETESLKAVLPCGIEYHHVGSTAVYGIMAKPIVDILLVVNEAPQIKQIAEILGGRGYLMMSAAERRISMNKGYTERGFAEKVFHLHIRMKGDADEIFFRDYLIAHPDTAKEYERLKLRLWKRYRCDRDAYTAAKTEFITKFTELAKRRSF